MFLFSEVMLFTCLLAFPTAEGNLRLTASHNQINALSTKFFTLKCMYESTKSHILSVELSKYDRTSNFSLKDLVFMDANAKVYILGRSNGVTYTGVTDGKDKAYLSGMWESVPIGFGGMYRCQVNIVDSAGQAQTLNSQLRVKEENITIATLVAATKKLQAFKQRHGKELESFAQKYKTFRRKIRLSLSLVMSRWLKWKSWTGYTFRFLESAIMKTVSSKLYKGKYYIAFNYIPPTVKYAEIYCLTRGGYLAELDDWNEWKFVASFLDGVDNTKVGYYVSGRRNFSNNTFYWPRHGKGIAMYTNWNPGQPNNYHGIQNCIELHQSFKWKMCDKQCDPATLGFICEVKRPKKRA